MAAMNKLFLLFLIFLVLVQAFADTNAGDSSSSLPPQKINCEYACGRRCSKTSRRKMCMRACGGCCRKCLCVPPGTAGNKEICPCYANMRTRSGLKFKCP